MMDQIDIRLSGRLGKFEIDAAFRAPGIGVTALFGPSGCGKTSILRAIAGLNRLHGIVRLGDAIWQDEKTFLPVYKRPIGYVFQEASLFPHLSVRRNLTYGMSQKQRESAPHFDEVIDILGISHLVERAPHHLSGGERQRVAIGRALLSDPSVLLMDEPLSALDRTTRDEILPYLEMLRDRLKLPIFYITHDMHEVERLADHLILMEQGKILASGRLETLQADPSLPLAKTREAAVSLDATLGEMLSDGLLSLHVEGAVFKTPTTTAPKSNRVRLRIAASDVSLAKEKPKASSILNVLPARILSVDDLGTSEKLVLLSLGTIEQDKPSATHILARLSSYSWQHLHFAIGENVYAQIKGVAVIARE